MNLSKRAFALGARIGVFLSSIPVLWRRSLKLDPYLPSCMLTFDLFHLPWPILCAVAAAWASFLTRQPTHGICNPGPLPLEIVLDVSSSARSDNFSPFDLLTWLLHIAHRSLAGQYGAMLGDLLFFPCYNSVSEVLLVRSHPQ